MIVFITRFFRLHAQKIIALMPSLAINYPYHSTDKIVSLIVKQGLLLGFSFAQQEDSNLIRSAFMCMPADLAT